MGCDEAQYGTVNSSIQSGLERKNSLRRVDWAELRVELGEVLIHSVYQPVRFGVAGTTESCTVVALAKVPEMIGVRSVSLVEGVVANILS